MAGTVIGTKASDRHLQVATSRSLTHEHDGGARITGTEAVEVGLGTEYRWSKLFAKFTFTDIQVNVGDIDLLKGIWKTLRLIDGSRVGFQYLGRLFSVYLYR